MHFTVLKIFFLDMSFIIIILWFYMSNVDASIDCKAERRLKVQCCPSEYENFCCPNVPFCSLNTNTNHFNVCITNPNDHACLAGLYSATNYTVKSCPNGFYCPAMFNCLIPCCKGCLCLNPESPCKQSYTLSNNVSVCKGQDNQTDCPEQYYCSNSSSKLKCKDGESCPKCSLYPIRCNLGGSCQFFKGKFINWIGLIMLVVISLMIYLISIAITRYNKSITNTNINSISAMQTSFPATSSEKTVNKEMCKIPIHITFKNLELKIKGHTILNETYGQFKPGYMTAVMGPSGCGKSSLLLSLLGKMDNYLTGTINFNDSSENNACYQKQFAFTSQDDIMHSDLTVREVLVYQGFLRLPASCSRQSAVRLSEKVLNLLNLSAIGDNVVGDVLKKGISGGQKRRVSIGMELMADPTVLFLDEPTSGLDSTISLEILGILRNLAETTNMTIVCVIHQPRREIFELFHNVLLLGSKGKVFYQCPPNQISRYFETLEYNFAEYSNPADIILDIVQGFHISAACSSSDLPAIWKKYEKSNFVLIHADSPKINPANNLIVFSRKSWIKQVQYLFAREMLMQYRSVRNLMIEFALFSFLGGAWGAFNRDTGLRKFLPNEAITALCLGLLVTLSSLRTFGNHKLVIEKEKSSGINQLSYFIAVNLSSIITTFFFSPVAFISFYFTLSNRRATYWEVYLNLAAVSFASSGLGHMLSLLLLPKRSHLVSIAIILLAVMSAGTNVSLCDLDGVPFIGPTLYSLSYVRWYLEASFEVEVNKYSDCYQVFVNHYASLNGYLLNQRSNCIAVLIGFGLITRAVSLMLLLFKK